LGLKEFHELGKPASPTSLSLHLSENIVSGISAFFSKVLGGKGELSGCKGRKRGTVVKGLKQSGNVTRWKYITLF